MPTLSAQYHLLSQKRASTTNRRSVHFPSGISINNYSRLLTCEEASEMSDFEKHCLECVKCVCPLDKFRRNKQMCFDGRMLGEFISSRLHMRDGEVYECPDQDNHLAPVVRVEVPYMIKQHGNAWSWLQMKEIKGKMGPTALDHERPSGHGDAHLRSSVPSKPTLAHPSRFPFHRESPRPKLYRRWKHAVLEDGLDYDKASTDGQDGSVILDLSNASGFTEEELDEAFECMVEEVEPKLESPNRCEKHQTATLDPSPNARAAAQSLARTAAEGAYKSARVQEIQASRVAKDAHETKAALPTQQTFTRKAPEAFLDGDERRMREIQVGNYEDALGITTPWFVRPRPKPETDPRLERYLSALASEPHERKPVASSLPKDHHRRPNSKERTDADATRASSAAFSAPPLKEGSYNLPRKPSSAYTGDENREHSRLQRPHHGSTCHCGRGGPYDARAAENENVTPWGINGNKGHQSHRAIGAKQQQPVTSLAPAPFLHSEPLLAGWQMPPLPGASPTPARDTRHCEQRDERQWVGNAQYRSDPWDRN